FSRGDLPRYRASVLARGRQPRGARAPAEADRGQGGGRPPPHAGRLPEGAHPERRERRSGARAAPPLRRELIFGLAAALVVAGAAAASAACDQGKQHDQPKTGSAFVQFLGSPPAIRPDGKFELAFDRLLLPSTAIRQSFQLRDGSGSLLSPNVEY